ncbi:glycine--tRNA ligase subunit beta [Erythrobacter oryzae]|uniref:glycine--tRNA ligase subunit beta n=1 Tax=Erythrobacter oryzae TaxID=3019556 RepID=UPI002557913A|nr:glycine--tRNA ligase subunit beta [Erythrobacter sp. COR-2]
MADFLLELRCEEIPARMQAGARAELEKLFRRELEAAGVKHDNLRIWSTPRRLALIAYDLPAATEAVSEEAKGPPEGAPDAAIDGFCKKAGVTRDQLELRDVKGRMTYFAVVATPGRPMAEVLAAAIPAIIRDFSWPKSMRWGAASITTDSLRWVRPLSGIVALLDGAVLDVEVGGIRSGRETMGHRFHHSGSIAIESAHTYEGQLLNARVIVKHTKREALIRQGAEEVAAAAGLKLVADEGLVIENAGLTENPVPLLGRFDEAFLDVPPEVIQLTARVNQKYFVCEDSQGKLANAFVCTANIAPLDPAVVVDGNRKVLAARLSDARFFWEQDQKTPLAVHAEKLSRITFHEKLGTVADKVERVAKLARWLVESDIVTPAKAGASGGSDHTPKVPASAGMTKEKLADMAEQAARLCKADLVTEMVGEFPELQGLMGGYYAAKEGLPQEVAEAIRDHYKPVGQGDDVPTAPVTVAVSLADKLDTLMCFFAINEKPTGSKDPFALRRAALAVIRLVLENGLRFSVDATFETMTDVIAMGRRDDEGQARRDELDALLLNEIASGSAGLHWFILDRLKVQQRDAGVRHDLIDAVVTKDDDLVRLLARVHALQAFVTTEDGANLLAGYKRAANILKKEGYEGPAGTPDPEVLSSLKEGNDTIPDTGEEDPLAMVDDPDVGDILAAEARDNPSLSYTPEPAEQALIDALDSAAPRAAQAVREERFADAMAALATLRAPIDRFFEEVTVNAEEADKRAARLALLARFRDAVHRVADFSRIEG